MHPTWCFVLPQGKLLTNSNTSSGLSQSILSDPCLLKSPTPSLPSLLSSDLARQQDMNANQSLWFTSSFFLLLSEVLLMHSNMWYLDPVQWCDCSSDRNQLLWCDISVSKPLLSYYALLHFQLFSGLLDDKDNIFPLVEVYLSNSVYWIWKLHSDSKIAQTLKIWLYLVNICSLSDRLSWRKSTNTDLSTKELTYSEILSYFQLVVAITCLCKYSILWCKYFAIVFSFEVSYIDAQFVACDTKLCKTLRTKYKLISESCLFFLNDLNVLTNFEVRMNTSRQCVCNEEVCTAQSDQYVLTLNLWDRLPRCRAEGPRASSWRPFIHSGISHTDNQ